MVNPADFSEEPNTVIRSIIFFLWMSSFYSFSSFISICSLFLHVNFKFSTIPKPHLQTAINDAE